MRLRSIPQDARDGVPQGDNSAGALVFGLLMVLVAVGFVGWQYVKRLLGPAPAPVATEPAAPNISQLNHLPLIQSSPLTLYAFDGSGQYLVPLQLDVTGADQSLAALREALNGSDTPPGLERLLPGDTELRDLRREGPLAIVDLPAAALSQAGGATGQQQLLAGLTRALTSIPGVTKVQFIVDGHPVAHTDAGVALDEAWTVDGLDGLNPVAADGGARGTFFFLDADGRYLVPTQLPIGSPETTMQTMLERLIEGPPPGTQLKAVWPEGLVLHELEYQPDSRKLILDLETNDPVQNWGLYRPALLIKAVVLTLRELDPISHLALRVNGEDVWSSGPFAEIRPEAARIDMYNPVALP